MKLLASLLLVFGVTSFVQGLTCYKCNVGNTQYNGYPTENCLHPVTTGSGATATGSCPGAVKTVEYCLTKFVIKDGVVTEASRGCAVAGTDYNTNSAAVPSSNQCVTQLNTIGNPTGSSTCYFPCSGNNCNTKSAANVDKCSSNCSSGRAQGSCNYITGKCVCKSGFMGADCSTADTSSATATIRQCVQCNSESDTSCTTSATAVACPSTQQYCSTTTTTIYASADIPLKTVTVRGCSATFSTTDECFFTNIHTDSPISDSAVGQHEVTCVATCDTNGCNTNTANGVVDGKETIPLYCVVCQDTSGDISPGSCAKSTKRTRCPSGSTHCTSAVAYLISERTDLKYSGTMPDFKVRNVDRACATTAKTTGCTRNDFGTVSGVKKVTCTESCQEDGCNVGWPARPNCIQCETGALDSYDECLENPPEATMCSYPFQAYCVVVDRGIQKGIRESIQGYPHRITRSCSHVDIGTNCAATTPRVTKVENCNRTCTTDGCNVGSGSSMPIQTMAAVVVAALLGWLAQVNS